jgi:hypothetical protein
MLLSLSIKEIKMLKTIFKTVLILAVVSACGKTSDDKKSPDMEMSSDIVKTEEGPGAFTPDYETSDSFFTMTPGIYDGDSPHGRVRIWYSKNIETLIQQESYDVPVGTVSVKQGYFDENDQYEKIVTMIKKAPGYDSEHKDWEYEVRTPNGSVEKNGKLSGCISCHSHAPETDYLMGTKVAN